MKIYTRKGDGGTTQLIGGTRIPKHSIRIESYGSVDELNSYLGLIRDQSIDLIYIQQIITIQDRLFTIGSHLASDPNKSTMKLPEIKSDDIKLMEKWIDEMDASLPPMKSFILPGGHTSVSFCHIARCVCRRAERMTNHLHEEENVDLVILKYLNRLSDYLFVLSRKLTQDLGAPEQPWLPKY